MVMVNPDNAPPAVRRELEECDHCELDREPRAWICEYHGGWWDGWEAATEDGAA